MTEQHTISSVELNVRLGLQPDLPDDDYHGLHLASHTYLSAFKKSPAHAREAMKNGGQATPALKEGKAIHTAVLQPELFRDRYIVADQCSGVTGKGQRCANMGAVICNGSWFCRLHAKGQPAEEQREILIQDQYDRYLCIAEAVHSHQLAASILKQRTGTETSGIWADGETGVVCKLRADALCAPQKTVIDLKTTTDASRAAFERSIFRFGYFRQGAHYLRGLGALDLDYEHFLIVAVEKQAPFPVAVYRLRDDVIEAGVEEIRGLLKQWAECERTGIWPAYSDLIEDIGLPAWGWRELEQIG